MRMLMAIWYVCGFVSLFACTKNKSSFAVETLRCFTDQKSGADVFEGIISILLMWPIIICLGPITLIRFKF